MANYALSFDGIDDYVDCGNGSSLDITNAITISMWIYKTADNNYMAPVSRTDSTFTDPFKGWNFAFRQLSAGGNLYFFYYDKNGNSNLYQTSIDASSYVLNGWHHITTSFIFGSGVAGKVYIDGIMKTANWGVGNGTVGINSLTHPILIGLNKGGSGGALQHQFAGSIDDVRIYNRALSADEIQALYSSSAGRYH